MENKGRGEEESSADRSKGWRVHYRQKGRRR